MPFKISISSEYACALISFAGVIISALISKNVAKTAANKEIEKMKLTWEREDVVTSEDEFSEMTAAVARYASSFRSTELRDALGKLAAVRAKESGALAEALDVLYQTVSTGYRTEIETQLSRVIAMKHSLKTQNSSKN